MRSSSSRGEMSWRWKWESQRPGLGWWVTFKTFCNIELVLEHIAFLFKPESLLTQTSPLFSGQPGWVSRVDFGHSWAINKQGWSSIVTLIQICASYYFLFHLSAFSGCFWVLGSRKMDLSSKSDCMILYTPITCDWHWYCLFHLNRCLDFSHLFRFLWVKLNPLNQFNPHIKWVHGEDFGFSIAKGKQIPEKAHPPPSWRVQNLNFVVFSPAELLLVGFNVIYEWYMSTAFHYDALDTPWFGFLSMGCPQPKCPTQNGAGKFKNPWTKPLSPSMCKTHLK